MLVLGKTSEEVLHDYYKSFPQSIATFERKKTHVKIMQDNNIMNKMRRVESLTSAAMFEYTPGNCGIEKVSECHHFYIFQ